MNSTTDALMTALNIIDRRKWGLDLSIPPGGGVVRAVVVVGAVTYTAQRVDAATAISAAIEYHERAHSDPMYGQPEGTPPLFGLDRS